MKKNTIKLTIAAMSAIALLAGCGKDVVNDSAIGEPAISEVNFTASVAGAGAAASAVPDSKASVSSTGGVIELKSKDGKIKMQMQMTHDGSPSHTKGNLINEGTVNHPLPADTVATFSVAAWTGDTKSIPTTDGYETVNYNQNAERWLTQKAYAWKTGETKTFVAYANLPSATDAASVTSPTKDGAQVLVYNVSKVPTASDQKDILMGYYQGSGNNTGTADIKFYHPLTAVKFVAGTLDSKVTAINSISIDGVYASGTATQSVSDKGAVSFAWTGTSSENTTKVSQTVSKSVPIEDEDKTLGEAFLLIPQVLSVASVKVTINVTMQDGDASKTVDLTATIEEGSWETGKTNTYTVNYSTSGPGPDPNYWVDLGMVSKNGHRLYVSRLPVASVTDGKATLTQDASQCAKLDFATASSITKDQFGLECRLIDKCELNDLFHKIGYATPTSGTPVFNFEYSWEQKGEMYGYKLSRNDDFFFMPINKEDDHSNISDYYATDDNGVQYCLFDRVTFNGHCTQFGYEVNDDDFVLVQTDIDSAHALVVYEDSNTSYSIVNKKFLFFHEMCVISQKEVTEENFPTYVWMYGGDNRVTVPNMCLVLSNGYCTTSNPVASSDCEFFYSSPYYKWMRFNKDGFSYTYLSDIFSEVSCTFTLSVQSCLAKGTLLTLADGSKKPVEDITYDDVVKVWNFDRGCYDTAKFLFVSKPGLKHDHYIKLTFSDGTVLNVTGQKSHHHVYNYTDRFFQGVTKMEPGTEVFTENGVVTLVSKEWIDEEVEYYNFITEEHVNCFANGVLTSSHYGNIYPIDENMKFIKDGRKKVPYSEFKKLGISREWYNGLRLGEQPDSLDVLKKYVDKVQSYQLEKPAPTFWQKIKIWWKSVFGR